MTNIKNPSISITLFSPERLLCWPRRSVSTKRASLWNTSWPLSTSSPVLYRIPTAEQVTTLNIITSSVPHTNSWTSDHSQHHHQFCTAHQQLNKWSKWPPSTSPVLHRTPTTEQVEHLVTHNIITSSAPHSNNWTSGATDYPQHHHQFCTTPQLNKWSNWLPSTSSPVLHHTPTEQQVKQLTTLNIITSSAPHTNWTSEATDYPQYHHQFCTTHQLNNKWSNWLPSTSPVLHRTPTEQVKQLTTLNTITSSAPHTNWTTSEATDYPQYHHQFCTTPQLNKWSKWLPSISSPVLHHTPTEQQVKQLTTLNIITSSAPHTNWTTSEASDYP